MTSPNIAEIVDGLSETQRNNLLQFRDGENYPFWATFSLIHKGLAANRKRWFVFGPRGEFLTRKGRLVRAHLSNPIQDPIHDKE